MKLESGSGNPHASGTKYWMALHINGATEDDVHRVMSLIGKKVVILGELGEDK